LIAAGSEHCDVAVPLLLFAVFLSPLHDKGKASMEAADMHACLRLPLAERTFDLLPSKFCRKHTLSFTAAAAATAAAALATLWKLWCLRRLVL
jgi:hypothetical protein